MTAWWVAGGERGRGPASLGPRIRAVGRLEGVALEDVSGGKRLRDAAARAGHPAWNVFVSARAPEGVDAVDTASVARRLAHSDLGGARQTRGYGPTSVDVEVHEVNAPTADAAGALVEGRVLHVLGDGWTLMSRLVWRFDTDIA